MNDDIINIPEHPGGAGLTEDKVPAVDPLVQINNNMHPNLDPVLVGNDWKNNDISFSDTHNKQKEVFAMETTMMKTAPKMSKVLRQGIPIFIGASDHKCDKIQEKILAYTLQKNSSAKLDITFLRASMFPGVSAMGWGTPFTGLRYVIPKLMGFKGKAIYMDMDMINFRDIEDFYNINLYGKPFGMVWDTKCNGEGGYCDSMLLMDCSKTNEFFTWEEVHDYYEKKCGFKWVFMERLRKYEDKDRRLKNEAVIRIDSRWNCFDGDITDGILDDKGKLPKYDLGQIFQLHLTALSYQPWHSSYLMSAKATHMRPDISDYWWGLVDEVNSLEF